MKLIISDSSGVPIYHNDICNDEYIKDFNPVLLSGIISAINVINFELFDSQIEEFSFRTRTNSQINIVFKENIQRKQILYFIFISSKDINKQKIKNLATNIFINTKNILLHNPKTKIQQLSDRINKIIKNNNLFKD